MSRELLGTVHEIILGELDPTLRVSVERQVEACTMDDKTIIMAVGRRLWPAAAEALAGSMRNARSFGDQKGRNLRQQLEMAIELFRLGPPLADVFLQLPAKPVRRLDEAHGRQVAGLLQALERLGERALALGTEALGHRLGDSALLLAVLQRPGADASPLRVLAASETAKRVVTELEAAADRLRHASTLSAEELAYDAVRLVGTLTELEKAPSDLPVDRIGLKTIFCKAGKAIGVHYQNALFGEVLDTFKRVAEPNASANDILRAEAVARAARRLAASGRELGLVGQIDLVSKTAFADFRSALAAAVQASSEDDRFMDQLRLIEIIFGADAAFELLLAGQRGCRTNVA